MIRYLLLLFLPLFLSAVEFKVASYNVENLFDTKNSGYEYKEYIPNSKSGWNEKMLSIKIKNIARVIKDIDADIISLQELENKEVLKRLNLALGSKKYPFVYSDFKTRSIDSVLLSRYPIKSHKAYVVNPRFRPIHKVGVEIEGLHVELFLNHWPSYSHSLKISMEFAKKLKMLYKNEKNFILLGDFNSPLVVDKKGWGKSVQYVIKDNFNLWYDYPKFFRYSHVFYRNKNALDHIISSKNMNYIDGSFGVFKPKYLQNRYKQPKRWLISKKGKGQHQGVGYSDHFAIYATFSTKKLKKKMPTVATIQTLLKSNKTRVNYILKDIMVINVNKYGTTIEDKNRDKIYVLKPDCQLKLGEVYTLHVKQLATYKGKKEIVLLDFNSCLDRMVD